MNNESLCNMSVMDMLNNPVLTTRLLTEMQSLLRNYGYADLAEVTAEFEIQLWGLKNKVDDLGADIAPLKNIWNAAEQLHRLVECEGVKIIDY